jgi:hypothetical protein
LVSSWSPHQAWPARPIPHRLLRRELVGTRGRLSAPASRTDDPAVAGAACPGYSPSYLGHSVYKRAVRVRAGAWRPVTGQPVASSGRQEPSPRRRARTELRCITSRRTLRAAPCSRERCLAALIGWLRHVRGARSPRTVMQRVLGGVSPIRRASFAMTQTNVAPTRRRCHTSRRDSPARQIGFEHVLSPVLSMPPAHVSIHSAR